jgi:hypothetical protein
MAWWQQRRLRHGLSFKDEREMCKLHAWHEVDDRGASTTWTRAPVSRMVLRLWKCNFFTMWMNISFKNNQLRRLYLDNYALRMFFGGKDGPARAQFHACGTPSFGFCTNVFQFSTCCCIQTYTVTCFFRRFGNSVHWRRRRHVQQEQQQ